MIPVLWHAQEKERGRYNCTAMLNDMLDHYECKHFACRDEMPQVDGGVVIVHGGREIGRIDKLNADIEGLEWAVLIFLGDEECSFPIEQVEHKNCKIWIQEPMPGRHDFADRYILDGYTPDTQRLKRSWGTAKNLDWVFAGQVTHARRRACIDALRTIDWGGVVVETKGYCQGVSIEEYYSLLSRSKIVPCPSGPFSPDAARPWEALECGALPILDDLSPVRTQPGFWHYVLGEHPLPVIEDWKELPDMIKDLKRSWEDRIAAAQKWWGYYLASFQIWLGEDIRSLHGDD